MTRESPARAGGSLAWRPIASELLAPRIDDAFGARSELTRDRDEVSGELSNRAQSARCEAITNTSVVDASPSSAAETVRRIRMQLRLSLEEAARATVRSPSRRVRGCVLRLYGTAHRGGGLVLPQCSRRLVPPAAPRKPEERGMRQGPVRPAPRVARVQSRASPTDDRPRLLLWLLACLWMGESVRAMTSG